MSSTPYIIPTRFTAIDGITPVVRSMSHNISDMATKLNSHVARQERLFRRLTPGLSSATKQLLAYGTAGAALAGIGATGKAIMDNETAMQSLSAVTGVVGDDFTRMRREVDALAKDTKKSSTDIAGSFEVVGSMMSEYLGDPKALREITKQGIILSRASRQEMVPTLENLTSIMNQFNIKAGLASKTVNTLTAGEIVGSLRTSQVSEALQEFGAGAYAANIDLAESVALTEALAKQMKIDKIGVGARNILTVMDSATGLSRKARKELKGAGVDMHFLMDKTKSLSERLHELAKVSGNEKAITKIFGRENKTAAQVIFNQLDLFDQYLAKIRVTEQAEKQAATNSATLENAVKELKNEWINYFVVEDKAKAGLTKLSEGTRFVTQHMDTLVNTGINVIGFFAAWKTSIIATKVVATGFNIALGIQTALAGASTLAMKGNTVALTTQSIAMKGLGIWTKLATADMAGLNAMMLANPAAVTAAAVVAVAGGLYMMYRHEQKLLNLYKEKMQLDLNKNIREEAAEVDNLAKKYFLLGNSIQKANALAVIEKKVKIDTDRGKLELEISNLKKQLEEEKNKIYLADLLAGGGTPEVGKRKEIAEALAAAQGKSNLLAQDNSFITQYAKNGVDAGLINKADLGGLFKTASKAPSESAAATMDFMGGDKKSEDFASLYEKLRSAEYNKQQKIVVEFKNAPAGTSVSSSSGISTPSSY